MQEKKKQPGGVTDDCKQIMLRAHPDVVRMWDRAAKERNLTRSAFFTYVAKAFDAQTVMIADPSTYGKWKQEELNQVLRTARVAARKEVKVVLQEEGFTTSGWSE